MGKKRKSSQKMKKLTVQESDAVILQFQRNGKKRGYLFCQKEKRKYEDNYLFCGSEGEDRKLQKQQR